VTGVLEFLAWCAAGALLGIAARFCFARSQSGIRPAPAANSEPQESADRTVSWIQTSLNAVDNADLIVDGAYGVLTRAAVIRFQQKHNLTVDGIVGPQTVAAIELALARL
jgi:peptidoglycan hydrolase-like protein with peptidoglycan-binding domain